LTIIPFNQTINYGVDVMWDGKCMTFADQPFGGSELQAGVSHFGDTSNAAP
jgi:hypothetical protein